MDIYGIIERFRKWWFNLSIDNNPIREPFNALITDFEYILARRDLHGLAINIARSGDMIRDLLPYIEPGQRIELLRIQDELLYVGKEMLYKGDDIFADAMRDSQPFGGVGGGTTRDDSEKPIGETGRSERNYEFERGDVTDKRGKIEGFGMERENDVSSEGEA